MNTVHFPGRTEFRIDRTSGTDPHLIAALDAMAGQAHKILAELIDPQHPPALRYHRTRDVDLFDVDFQAEQVDVYVNSRLIRRHIAEHLAAQTTHYIRTRIAGRRDDDGSYSQALQLP
ncbi:hypothetical protein [Nonomuraea sp. 10N515B]|uniref:hypothetical protein n=1 Tax=Nonomuraea sp. 10N515B TaxID=3457422 RepID=UPI003FCC9C7C